MRIATITNWAYGATVFLTMISGTVLILASGAEERERVAVEQRAQFDQLTDTLEEDAFRLTEQARLYSVSGDPTHLVVYREEASALRSVEQRVAKLHDVGAQPAELETLKKGLHWADSLIDEQQAAIAAMERKDDATARQIIFSPEYERDLARANQFIDQFQFMLDHRSENAVIEATKASRLLRTTSEIMLGITALLVLFVLSFILKHRVLRPVVRLSDVVNRLAAQDFAVEPPNYSQIDEIGDMAQAIRIFRENGLERQRLELQRDADQAMRDLLSRMTQRLQGCDTIGNLAEVVSLFASEIAPMFSGRLYIHDRTGDMMNEACSWLSPQASRLSFPPSDCWALRRGQLHRPGGNQVDIACAHLKDDVIRNPICVPLIAQGETIGLLYFEQHEDDPGQAKIAEVYLELMAETVGLALANLELRDALREMAMVDPLTGLFNRHHLESLLKVQLAQAERTGEPVSCLMLDIDHFKKFNDSFGHDAGDAVLRAVGALLTSAIRQDGVAFRMGGEEFMLLIPGLDMEHARMRAEDIRQRIRALELEHKGTALGPVTVSCGLATFPSHGPSANLVQTADAALMRAKQQGRDRIVLATVREGAWA